MSWNYRKFVSVFATVTAIALGIRLFLIESYSVSTDSMRPALVAGDFVLASKFVYNLHLPFSNFELFRLRAPLPGEVVAFALPDEGLKVFIKRVVASEGDTVELKKGQLFINGKAATYQTSPEGEREILPNGSQFPIARELSSLKDFGPIDVPRDHFFVLGDNRGASVDSRLWGPVPRSCLKGKPIFVWFSKVPQGGLRISRTLASVH